jgi:hypothetical protein
VGTGFINNNEYIDRTGQPAIHRMNIPRRKGEKDRQEKL